MSTINHNHVLSLLQEQYTTINVSFDNDMTNEEAFRLALVEVERQKQREAVLKDINEHLPPDSEARKLFDAAISEAKVLPHAE